MKKLLISLAMLAGTAAFAQDVDPMSILNEMKTDDGKDPIIASFKGTRMINQHTIEVGGKRSLDFRIAHRFGPFNSGAYDFWGLDQGASIRLSLEYSYDGRLQAGIGRSNIEKTFDGFLKYRLLRQTNDNSMPISVTLFSGMYYTNLQGAATIINGQDKYAKLSSRFSFAQQIMIARKFTERLSLQVSPTMVHYNLVDNINDQNDTYAIGFLGRYKFSKRSAITFEWMPRLNEFSSTKTYYNTFGVGLDIETGGHVFQIHLTNSLGLTENQFVPKTADQWKDGGIRLGFNISRMFSL
jgi:hypothetical protein